jgi:hypothetical protein
MTAAGFTCDRVLALIVHGTVLTVCTENSDTDVVVMQSTEEGM